MTKRYVGYSDTKANANLDLLWSTVVSAVTPASAITPGTFQNAIFDFPNVLRVAGSANGVMAMGGEVYSHVMLAVGFQAVPGGNNGNPLTYVHQVGVYSAVKGNGFATGEDSFVIGFETALGQQAGAGTLKYAVNYSTGQFFQPAGSSVERTHGFMTYDESAGTLANTAMCDYTSALAITGNWFISYGGSRPSRFNGPMIINNTLQVSDTFTAPLETYRSDNASYLRITGGTAAGGSGFPNLTMYGRDNPTPGTRQVLQLATATPSAPTGDDGTIQIVTQAGTAKMDRAASWTFPVDVTVAAKFGCNGATAQAKATLGAASTDLASVVTLANNLRTMALNNGMGQN